MQERGVFVEGRVCVRDGDCLERGGAVLSALACLWAGQLLDELKWAQGHVQ